MKKIICSIGLIVAACSVAVICSSCGKKEERGELKRIWYNGSYNRDFKDLNDVHLAEFWEELVFLFFRFLTSSTVRVTLVTLIL